MVTLQKSHAVYQELSSFDKHISMQDDAIRKQMRGYLLDRFIVCFTEEVNNCIHQLIKTKLTQHIKEKHHHEDDRYYVNRINSYFTERHEMFNYKIGVPDIWIMIYGFKEGRLLFQDRNYLNFRKYMDLRNSIAHPQTKKGKEKKNSDVEQEIFFEHIKEYSVIESAENFISLLDNGLSSFFSSSRPQLQNSIKGNGTA